MSPTPTTEGTDEICHYMSWQLELSQNLYHSLGQIPGRLLVLEVVYLVVQLLRRPWKMREKCTLPLHSISSRANCQKNEM